MGETWTQNKTEMFSFLKTEIIQEPNIKCGCMKLDTYKTSAWKDIQWDQIDFSNS